MENLKKQYQGQRVLIVGLGFQGGGLGLARFFAELGAKVKVTDKRSKDELKASVEKLQDLQIEYSLGGHKLTDFLDTDIIFKGPSVPWTLPQIIEAEKKGIEIDMESTFFIKYCPSKNIIGVTGTRGKSTTSLMIYELLLKLGKKVYLGGSIPNVSTISLLKKVKPDDFVVLELPSWHLSGFYRKRVSPHIAVFTNFYPDHLNYYKDMTSYLFDKKAIYINQKKDDFLIINEKFRHILGKDSIKSRIVYFDASDFTQEFSYLQGAHNRQNAAAALKTVEILGITSPNLVENLSNFKGLSSRQQVIGQKNGIFFVNDTTSTTPIATIAAIQTFANKPVVLLLGGQSKNLPYSDLLDSLQFVKGIVLLKGSFTEEVLPELEKKYKDKLTTVFDNMQEAVLKAYSLAKKIRAKEPEVFVILSPGATSFATYHNEFERGRVFNEAVKKICPKSEL